MSFYRKATDDFELAVRLSPKFSRNSINGIYKDEDEDEDDNSYLKLATQLG